jgi:hypothetical protein
MPMGLWVTVFEALGRDGQPKFNAHLIVIMPDADARDRLIESLQRSSVYVGRVDARPVDSWNSLTAYLLKEATPAAWFAAGKSFRRIRGSIPLGDLGGDRVVVSRDLKDALIASGRIAPFKRTYAKRQPSPPSGALSYHSPRLQRADRPPLEPTPMPPAGAHHAIQGPAAEPAARAAKRGRVPHSAMATVPQRTDELRAVDKRVLQRALKCLGAWSASFGSAARRSGGRHDPR